MSKREVRKEIKSDVEMSTKPKVKKSLSLDEAKTEVVKEIAESIYKILMEEEKLEESNETDWIFKDKVGDIIETVLNEFESFANEGKEKKSFASNLVKIFAILLTKKCNALIEIKNILKLEAEIALQLWPKQKQQ